ncbi:MULTISPECIES: hypothetical protein [unclassified Tolypothrix]|nr:MULTISPECIES: hypothetical protein [unclassified Tolypothrix]EKF03931.1 hypothetical protein FDUTEX481_02934 [Tolypothrix sp. PCC 7601]UYD30250.1 hypothetical protein HGR01_08380 [Tolypothrix sp. PCC 7712]UYD38109.1 hypothetical protein HG267_10245 [Tolypothrix sp. PCC 7601]BAY94314.1 hypothetical protein NIES3275_63600 [Microchaete diplosiphon NIES-3275]
MMASITSVVIIGRRMNNAEMFMGWGLGIGDWDEGDEEDEGDEGAGEK